MGKESGRMDRPFHGSRNGHCGRPGGARRSNTFDSSWAPTGEMGRKGCRSGSDDGNGSARSYASLVPYRTICRIQGNRGLEQMQRIWACKAPARGAIENRFVFASRAREQATNWYPRTKVHTNLSIKRGRLESAICKAQASLRTPKAPFGAHY